MHVRHLAALRQCQLPSGMFGQVLNVPGSYQEFTVTCMIGYAMARAVRRRLARCLVSAYHRPGLAGVTERIDDAGGLVDCCTNTGVQGEPTGYLDRPAIFGRDDRGGAMALWFAVEMRTTGVRRGGDQGHTPLPACYPLGLVQVRDVSVVAIIEQCWTTLIAADHALGGL